MGPKGLVSLTISTYPVRLPNSNSDNRALYYKPALPKRKGDTNKKAKTVLATDSEEVVMELDKSKLMLVKGGSSSNVPL